LRIAFSNAERSVANGTQIDAACQKRRLGVSAMERGPFERGYVAGWQYVRGSEDVPANVPQSPMRIAAEGAIAAAVEGLGIVMTPLGVCRRELERGELVRVLPEWDAGTVELNAVYASARAAKPSARAFVDYLVAALHETERPPSEMFRQFATTITG
jgi:DNA-binding transcriptional LysR family regulator